MSSDIFTRQPYFNIPNEVELKFQKDKGNHGNLTVLEQFYDRTLNTELEYTTYKYDTTTGVVLLKKFGEPYMDLKYNLTCKPITVGFTGQCTFKLAGMSFNGNVSDVYYFKWRS